MNIRLADIQDLSFLKEMYLRIVRNMEKQKLCIWDEVYPSEFIKADIEQRIFYVCEEEGLIKAAFSLCGSHAGESCVRWPNQSEKVVYMDKFGVNVDSLRQGIGGKALWEATVLARQKGAASLRLFVVDRNKPAIALYEKNGFVRAEGIYEERIDEELTFCEYGYEILTEKE